MLGHEGRKTPKRDDYISILTFVEYLQNSTVLDQRGPKSVTPKPLSIFFIQFVEYLQNIAIVDQRAKLSQEGRDISLFSHYQFTSLFHDSQGNSSFAKLFTFSIIIMHF